MLAVVDVLGGELQPGVREVFEMVRHRRCVDPRLQAGEREVVPQASHDQVDLLDVHCLAADSSNQEAPVRHFEFGCGEADRLDVKVWVLGLALRYLVLRGEQEHIFECFGVRVVLLAQDGDFLIDRVRARHGRELGRVVLGRAVVEENGCQWARQHVDAINGHGRHLDDGPECVALAAPLHAEQADGVCRSDQATR